MIARRARLCAALATWTLVVAVPVLNALPVAAKIKAAFDAINATRKGAINVDEWDVASFALFRAADKNNDNFIDRDELKASTMALDTFLRADVDRDGRLSVAEFTELRRAIFETADIDRNDFVTLVEFELMIVMEQVGWQDRNQNGRIELSELGASLAKAFDELDADHDGTLSPAEAAFMRPAAFSRYDTNRDGTLTREEYVSGYRTEMMSG
ncbi:MAG: hypothetical protein EXS37_08785 [Opitutus sp.]|nr:hypothetical protein [Opitutus sp.]